MQPLLTDIANKQPRQAFEQLSKKVDGVDKLLYLQERGRVSGLIGNYDASIQDLKLAQDLHGEGFLSFNRATISMSDIAAQAASIVTNDNIIPYEGESYELVFNYTYQMLNYLNKKEIESARVEMDNAYHFQEIAREHHDLEILQAEQRATKYSIDRGEIEKQLIRLPADMELVASKVENSFQNAFTFYISGVLREMLGDERQYREAYIDYKRAWKIYPENKYVIQSLYRLAIDQKRPELPMLRDKYGKMNMPKTDTAKVGRLVVLYEDGFVPPKDQIKLSLPIAGKLYTVAMPYYSFQWKEPVQINIYDGNNAIGQTEPICLVRSLAVKALKEKYFAICIRQILRLIAKDQIQRVAEKKGGVYAKIGFAVTDAVITNADMRSWLTLPDNLQVADFWLPPGNHSVAFGVNPTPSNRFDVNIRSGETHFLHVTNTGRGCYAKMINPYDTIIQTSTGKRPTSK
jgi:hypothetical protein